MVGLLLLIVIGVYHRLKARTGEKLDRMQEGVFGLVALRLLGLAGMIALTAYLSNPANLGFSAVALPNWARWIGVGLGCMTLCLLFWTLRSLGKNLTDTVVTRKHHTLVTEGPYRWVRHPFYVCAVMITLAASLVSANAIFLAAGGLFSLFLALRTRVEEAHLLSRFGEEYREYRDRTGRFFPRFGRLWKKPRVRSAD